MKEYKKIGSIALILFLVSMVGNAQTFEPPQLGKTAIYFARLDVMGFMVPFEFMHQEKFIGAFAGRGYFRYECDPGPHLFWASSENKEFLTADLLPNAVYLVIVDVKMGAMVSQVGLRPVNAQDPAVPKVEAMLDKKPASNYSQKEKDERTADFSLYTPKIMKQYEKRRLAGKPIPHISENMAIRVLQVAPSDTLTR